MTGTREPEGSSTSDRWKYAHVEREVRFLLPGLPALPPGGRVLRIDDRYVRGTGLRLRRVVEPGLPQVLKLGQKVRPDAGSPAVVAHTTMYLTPVEYEALQSLPADLLTKTRHLVPVPCGLVVAVDDFQGALTGLVTAEVDLGEHPDGSTSLDEDDVVAALLAGGVDVTADERYTGGALSAAPTPPVAENRR